MFKTEIDVDALLANMTALEVVQLPYALTTALNNTAFQSVRPGWSENIGQVFDRPTPLTLNAPLVKQAKLADAKAGNVPVAEIYLRNESAGTPPSRYLITESTGGPRREKPVEFHLRQAGIIGSDEFIAPARGAHLDAFGNLPGGDLNTMLSDLQAHPDPLGRSTAESRAKRLRSKARGGRQGTFFVSNPTLSASQGKAQKLPRGIYKKISTGFGQAIQMFAAIIKQPTYTKRFDALGLTQKLFYDAFPAQFAAAMKKALESRK